MSCSRGARGAIVGAWIARRDLDPYGSPRLRVRVWAARGARVGER